MLGLVLSLVEPQTCYTYRRGLQAWIAKRFKGLQAESLVFRLIASCEKVLMQLSKIDMVCVEINSPIIYAKERQVRLRCTVQVQAGFVQTFSMARLLKSES